MLLLFLHCLNLSEVRWLFLRGEDWPGRVRREILRGKGKVWWEARGVAEFL
jgi:hypothetical protein